MLKHVQEWAEDYDGSIVVDGTSLKTQGKYYRAYDVICDKYGLVVHGDKHFPAQLSWEKRQRELHSEMADEILAEDGKCRTPVRNKKRTGSTLGYPSPPTSSPQIRSVSSPPNAADHEDGFRQNIRTEGEWSSSSASSTCVDQTEPSRSTEIDHSDNRRGRITHVSA